MNELNKAHHGNFLDNTLPDGCAQLIIMDPPYFETKGEFDFIWPNFAAYLEDVRKWASEVKRLLAPNGTLFWYGPAKRIAYTQIILDEMFNILNVIVWDKGPGYFAFKAFSSEMRSFADRTERILMYDHDTFNLTDCVNLIRDYIRQEITNARGKVVLKEVNEALGTATNGGGVASACLSLDKEEPAMITEEMYLRLQAWLGPDHLLKPYDVLRSEYESKRAEYETKRRYFNNQFNLQDVMEFSNEANTTGAKYDHPTVKPETLSRAMILSTTRPGDLVVVPMCGSGTECSMAAREGRRFIGFDIDPKHIGTTQARVYETQCKPLLF